MAPAAGSSLACRVYPTQPFSAQAVALQGSLQSGVQGMQGGMMQGMQGGRQREPSAHKRTLQQARTRGGYRRGGLTLTA